MKIKMLLTIAMAALGLLPMVSPATLIGFEDLTTRDSFNTLGILDTYQGYEWGYGLNGGTASRTFVNRLDGWASATVANPAISPAPSGMGGTSYAWNYNGTQSLWIDFGGATDVLSVDLANLSSAYGANADFVQLFGYDATDSIIGSTAPLALASTFQTLSANLASITYLEIRANNAGSWFSVDNLVVQIPEPASIGLLGLVSGGLFFTRRIFAV